MSDVLLEMAELVYGGAGAELVSKMNPTQSDVASKDRFKRKVTAGLSAVGAGAGALGLAVGAKEVARHGWKGTPKLTRSLLPVEVAGLGGELMATKILHGDSKRGVAPKGALKPVQAKKPRKVVVKRLRDTKLPTTKGVLVATATHPKVKQKGAELGKQGAGALRKLPAKVSKRDDVDVRWEGEISKAEPDKQQIFGWASVVEVNGEPVVDLQGDYISVDEMEKAAYEFVTKSRKGGDMHLRDDWNPIQKSEMIESFVITEDKRDAMNLPDSVPTGWWVGFKVADSEVWDKIRKGERTGFSIHGKGKRTPV